MIFVIILLDAQLLQLSDAQVDPSPSIKLTKDTDEQIRRDSLLFEEVSQGLVKLDSSSAKVEKNCKF